MSQSSAPARMTLSDITPQMKELFRLALIPKNEGNPFLSIGIRQMMGGSKHRMFAKLQAAGFFDRGNVITKEGRELAAKLFEEKKPNIFDGVRAKRDLNNTKAQAGKMISQEQGQRQTNGPTKFSFNQR